MQQNSESNVQTLSATKVQQKVKQKVKQEVYNNYVALLIKQFVFTKLVESLYQ